MYAHCKKSFTLIETIIALLIASTALFLSSRMQMGSLIRINTNHMQLERLYKIKESLYFFFMDPPKKETKKNKDSFDEPRVIVTTQYQEIPKKSSLFKWNERLRRIESNGEWSDGTVKKTKNAFSLTTWILVDPPAESTS